jgi:hypothetical protein
MWTGEDPVVRNWTVNKYRIVHCGSELLYFNFLLRKNAIVWNIYIHVPVPVLIYLPRVGARTAIKITALENSQLPTFLIFLFLKNMPKVFIKFGAGVSSRDGPGSATLV